MKAAVVCANEDVQYLDYEEPIPGPGEVKVKVRASGICGSDIPRVLHNGVHFYPIVLGHEFSGDVVEIGEGVTKVKVGDRVSGAPLKPCMKCDDCQNGNFSLCKHYSFIGSREQGSNADLTPAVMSAILSGLKGLPDSFPVLAALFTIFHNRLQN